MESGMKNEFEEYVSKLTSSICKDIFLEEFKDLCNQMNGNIETYEKLSGCMSESIETNKKLFGEISYAEDKLDKGLVEFKNNTCLIVQNMIDENKQLKGYTGNLFNELKKQHFNESKNYRKELDNCLENKKVQIREMIESQVINIENILKGIITRDDIRKFIEEIRENAKQSKELANFVNSAYKDKIGKSVIAILQQTDRAQEDIHDKLSKHVDDVLKQLDIVTSKDQVAVNKYVADFQESVNKQVVALEEYFVKCIDIDKQSREIFLKRQEDLINQIVPRGEKLEELKDRIDDVESLLKKMEYDRKCSDRQLDLLLKGDSDKREEIDEKLNQKVEFMETLIESLSKKTKNMVLINSIAMVAVGLLMCVGEGLGSFIIIIVCIIIMIFIQTLN